MLESSVLAIDDPMAISQPIGPLGAVDRAGDGGGNFSSYRTTHIKRISSPMIESVISLIKHGPRATATWIKED